MIWTVSAPRSPGADSIRIGLTPRDFLGWQGGRELFALIHEALAASLDGDDDVSLVSGIESHSRARRAASRVRTWAAGLARGSRPASRVTPAEPIGTQPYRRGAVAVIGPLISPPLALDIPWVGYIPDVQHRHLPDLFSARERAARDRRFRSVLDKAPVVMVNAADVANDLRHCYPGARAKIVALPFAACAEPDWFTGLDDIRARYGIEGDFFLCSNQLWKHKNHGVLLDAAMLARQRGTPVRFVLTGETRDYRHPDHVSHLLGRIAGLDLAGEVRVLGFLPKPDQIALMRAARGVVQPSLFEGSPGGGAIYNAIALGRPTIVSDLPVNREIAHLVTHFFDPADPEDLLDKLLAVQAADPVEIDQDRLLQESAARRRSFGEAVRQIFAEAVRAY